MKKSNKVGRYALYAAAVPACVFAGSVLAETVYVRQSCVDNGTTIPNCYDPSSFQQMLTWIHDTRKPNADAPLTIDVGEGRFALEQFPRGARGSVRFECDASTGFTGYITMKGAGRDASVIGFNSGYTLVVSACQGMTFKDLQFSAYGNSGGAISWSGGGDSVWENVDIESQYYAWISRTDGCGAARGKHYWFNSRIHNVDAFSADFGYKEECDESWFFSSEIMTVSDQDSTAPAVFTVANSGEVHVYGSVIRAQASAQLPAGKNLAAVRISNGGSIHIHGTGIDVISPFANDIVALEAGQDAEVHVVESSYNMSTGTGGTITRISNNGGHVHAPFAWPSHAEPPAIASTTGADTAIVTNTADGHPHMVIYDVNCASSWFDATLNMCR